MSVAIKTNPSQIDSDGLQIYFQLAEELSHQNGFACSDTNLPLVLRPSDDPSAAAINAVHALEHVVVANAVLALETETFWKSSFVGQINGRTCSLIANPQAVVGHVVSIETNVPRDNPTLINDLVVNLFLSAVQECNEIVTKKE